MLPLTLLAALALTQAAPPPVRVNGYVAERASGTLAWDVAAADAPAQAKLYGAPAFSSLTEGNLQIRVRFGEGYDAFLDTSFFVTAQSSASGVLGEAPTPANRLEPSELYLNLGFHEHLNGLVGRKRLVWGSGFAVNPTDLLNPPKDPTDNALQRSGAWMARLEAPFEKFTLTALWAAKVTATDYGLPTRFLFKEGKDEPEHLVAVRGYALLFDSDVNLMWFWSNRYADALPHSHRFAASFSRYFFTDYELHAEAVVQRGRDTLLVDPACVGEGGSILPVAMCAVQGRAIAGAFAADSQAVYVKLLVGTRYTFKDESMLSAEYLYDGTGLSGEQWDARSKLVSLLPDLAAFASKVPAGSAIDPSALLGGGDTGQPLRFGAQTQRRHYLFLVYQKPRIWDDFAAAFSTVVGLEGPSALLAPSVTWNVRDWIGVSLFAFVPVGASNSEHGSVPFRFRAMLEVKAFY